MICGLKRLLFDLNYKFIKIGASLLALAKSIYYDSISYTKRLFPKNRARSWVDLLGIRLCIELAFSVKRGMVLLSLKRGKKKCIS